MKEPGINRVAIIGAGLMGFGIGLDFARFGYEVTYYNTSKKSSDLAMTRAKEALDLMVETELLSQAEATAAYKLLHPFTDVEEAARGADLVIESAPETPALKQDLFAQLDKLLPTDVILASNTSAIRITEIASKSIHQERILRAHYFSPAQFIPLVEVHGGEKTNPELVEKLARILRGVRKRVVIFTMDIPGAIGSRIQQAQNNEIQALIDKGICDPHTMDDVIQYGFARRLPTTGFFRRCDYLGLDFIYTVSKGHGNEPWKPIAQHVEKGEYGMKSGKGFYDWPGDSAAQINRKLNLELIRYLKEDMENGAI
jgi:3-hydroxyacyl-CoA dehydrogenase